ncbi:MAG: phosphotransferase, partial [bacterium]|nr:phosphotransferase [bacterium]
MKRAQAWIEGLRRTGIARFDELPGGAGARHYWRVSFEDGTSAVLMHALPEDPAILPPGLRSAPDEIPFVAMTAFLAQRGLPVPEIYAVDYDERWILLEDLGNTHLCDLPETSLVPRLREAVRLIARLHRATPEGELPFRRLFDREWIAFELQTFVEHGLRGSETGTLREALDALAGAIEVLPRVVCLRDYQSQNLMIDARERLRILDYQ